VLKMDEAEEKAPTLHFKDSEELNAAIMEAEKSGAINPHHAVTLQSARRTADKRFAKMYEKGPDESVQGEFYDRLLSVRTDADVSELRDWMRENWEAFGDSYDTRVKELYEHRDRQHDNAIKASVDLAVGDLHLPSEDRVALTQWALAKVKEEKLEPSRVANLVAQEAVALQAAKETKPPLVMSKMLAILETGKRYKGLMGDFDKIKTRKDAIEAIVKEGWYDARLRPQDRAELRRRVNAKFPGDEKFPELPEMTDEEYDRLPSGTVFHDASGKRYRKP